MLGESAASVAIEFCNSLVILTRLFSVCCGVLLFVFHLKHWVGLGFFASQDVFLYFKVTVTCKFFFPSSKVCLFIDKM